MNAALIAMHAVDVQRESFREADHRSAAPGLEEALHACDGKPLLGVQPQGSHGGGKFSGGAVLLEAQEYVEIEKREQMRREGLLRYGCGKCELLRLGALDDVDIVVGHHASCTTRAAPMTPAVWAWWPQQWAAPVAGLAY